MIKASAIHGQRACTDTNESERVGAHRGAVEQFVKGDSRKKTIRYFETSESDYPMTRRHIPEERSLRPNSHENLKTDVESTRRGLGEQHFYSSGDITSTCTQIQKGRTEISDAPHSLQLETRSSRSIPEFMKITENSGNCNESDLSY